MPACFKEYKSAWARGKLRNLREDLPCHLYLFMLMMDASSLLCSCGRNPGGYGAESGCSTIAFNCAGIANGVLHGFFTGGGEANPPIPYRGDASIHPHLRAAHAPTRKPGEANHRGDASIPSPLRAAHAPTRKQRSIVSLLFELVHSKFAGVDHTRAVCFGAHVTGVFALAQFALFGFNKFARESMIERFPLVEYQ